MRCYKAAHTLANWIWCTFFKKNASCGSLEGTLLRHQQVTGSSAFPWNPLPEWGQQRWSFACKKVPIFCCLTVESCQGGARRRSPRSERQASSLGALQDETFSFGPGCLVLCLLWSVIQFSLWDGDRSSVWSSTDLGRRGPLLPISSLSQLCLCTARSRLFLSLVLFHPRLKWIMNIGKREFSENYKCSWKAFITEFLQQKDLGSWSFCQYWNIILEIKSL